MVPGNLAKTGEGLCPGREGLPGTVRGVSRTLNLVRGFVGDRVSVEGIPSRNLYGAGPSVV